MTDKELLEKAAKAAGGEFLLDDFIPRFMSNDPGIEYEWDPLADDGDALRLAVKLKMNIVYNFDRVMVVFGNKNTTEHFYDLPQPTDRYAATRKAIVRAAATIGE